MSLRTKSTLLLLTRKKPNKFVTKNLVWVSPPESFSDVVPVPLVGDGDIDVNFIDAAVIGLAVVGDTNVDGTVVILGNRSPLMLNGFEVLVVVDVNVNRNI